MIAVPFIIQQHKCSAIIKRFYSLGQHILPYMHVNTRTHMHNRTHLRTHKCTACTHSCRPEECKYHPGQKNRHSRDIHEIDPLCDHVISCDIDFDLQRAFAMRRYRGSRRCRTEVSEVRYRTILHDLTIDQPHEFLGCNDFFWQG